jgi:hypothetical protein
VTLAVKEAGLQKPVSTNRKYIRGKGERISKHIIAKSVSNNLSYVDVPSIGGRNKLLPGEVSLFTS